MNATAIPHAIPLRAHVMHGGRPAVVRSHCIMAKSYPSPVYRVDYLDGHFVAAGGPDSAEVLEHELQHVKRGDAVDVMIAGRTGPQFVRGVVAAVRYPAHDSAERFARFDVLCHLRQPLRYCHPSSIRPAEAQS